MAGDTEQTMCARHPTQALASHCSQCGKGICRECVEQYGYFCSPECLAATRSAVSRQEKESVDSTRQMMAKAYRYLAMAGVAVVLIVLAIGGYFVWKLFLTPVGKVAWRWEEAGDIDSLRIIGQQDERVYVQTGTGIAVLNVRTGEHLRNLDNPELSGLTSLHVTGDGFVGQGATRILRLDADGKTLAKFDLEGWGTSVTLSDDYAYACCFTNIPPAGSKVNLLGDDDDDDDDDDGDYESEAAMAKFRARMKARMEAMAASRRLLIGIDLTAGKELWRKELPGDVSLQQAAFGETGMYAVYRRNQEERGTEYALVAYDPTTGQQQWRKRIDYAFGWGVKAFKGVVVVAEPTRLVAMGEDGTVRWAITYTDEDDLFFFQQEDLLFCGVIGGTHCYELATGKLKWRTNLEFSEGDVFMTGESVVVQGELTKKTELNIGEMPGFDQDPDVLKEFGLDKVERDESIPVLVCLDRQSGKLRWKNNHVIGRVFCDAERLVLFMDTAETSRLSIFKDSSETVIRQYDLDTGQKLYERVHQIGVSKPTMIDRYLVGIQYDTAEAMAKSKITIAEAASGEARKPVGSSGVVAFRLK